MRLRMRTEVGLFTEGQLEKLMQDALRVWRDIPFRIQGTDEFFDALTAYGCAVDGEAVRFPKAVREKVLARIAEEKRRREETRADPDGELPTELEMYTHGQALHICDLETNALRPATEGDLVRWCHLVDALGVERRAHPTFIPQDVPRHAADFHAFATIILHSRRPHRVSVYSVEMLPFFIEACTVVKGSLEEVKHDPVFATKCWVNSPFMITRENVAIALEARRRLGTPVVFGHMPVAAAACPVTVAGSLVQNTAESLGLCAMSLALNDRTHKITATSAVIDMKDLHQRQSGPDRMLHMVAGAQMQAYLFGGRPEITLGGVAAATVSAQSVYEKALACGFNRAVGDMSMGIGCLAFSDVGSPVQLALDYEMGQCFNHLLREVAADDDHVGLETILATAPLGARFMESEHTARFFREECWLPAFEDHRPPLAWARDPSDMIDRARERARALDAGAENQCPLPEAKRAEIRRLLDEADAAS